jgi:hypothetical protein
MKPQRLSVRGWKTGSLNWLRMKVRMFSACAANLPLIVSSADFPIILDPNGLYAPRQISLGV